MSKLINFSEKERVKGHTRRGQRVNPFIRKRESKNENNAETIGAGLLGGYAAMTAYTNSLPTDVDIWQIDRTATDLGLKPPTGPGSFLGKLQQDRIKKSQKDYYDTIPGYRKLVDQEKNLTKYEANRAKYTGTLNRPDVPEPARQKGLTKLKKRYGVNIADDQYAKKVSKTMSGMKQKQLDSVLKHKGVKTGKNAARNALIIGLGAAGAAKGISVINRKLQERKKQKKRSEKT